MHYPDFENLISAPRMSRYLSACNDDTKKAMTLYRANLRLSQELFSILSIFEVVLRNKIDSHYRSVFHPIIRNEDWLIYAASPGGFYDNGSTSKTRTSILKAKSNLGENYTHNKLLAELNFGFWRFQFGPKEFRAAGSNLHQIFVKRSHGTNHTSIFNRLQLINKLRNRIAHHEPICFDISQNTISNKYAIDHFDEIITLLRWMDISHKALFYGINGVSREIAFLNNLNYNDVSAV